MAFWDDDECEPDEGLGDVGTEANPPEHTPFASSPGICHSRKRKMDESAAMKERRLPGPIGTLQEQRGQGLDPHITSGRLSQSWTPSKNDDDERAKKLPKDSDEDMFERGAWLRMLQELDLPPYTRDDKDSTKLTLPSSRLVLSTLAQVANVRLTLPISNRHRSKSSAAFDAGARGQSQARVKAHLYREACPKHCCAVD